MSQRWNTYGPFGGAEGAISLVLLKSNALPSSQITSFLPPLFPPPLLSPSLLLFFLFLVCILLTRSALCLPVLSSNLAPLVYIVYLLTSQQINLKLRHLNAYKVNDPSDLSFCNSSLFPPKWRYIFFFF